MYHTYKKKLIASAAKENLILKLVFGVVGGAFLLGTGIFARNQILAEMYGTKTAAPVIDIEVSHSTDSDGNDQIITMLSLKRQTLKPKTSYKGN